MSVSRASEQKEELVFRWAKQGDLSLIEEFVQREFGPHSVQATAARIRWLYFAHPHGLHVALCTDRYSGVVAICGHLPQPVRIAGQEIMAGLGIDFMVAPAWRRRGIGRRFLEMRLERFALSLSVGQSHAMSSLYHKFQALDLGGFQIGYYRRKPSRSLHPRTFARESLTWVRSLGGLTPADGPWRAVGAEQLTPWQRWRYVAGPYGDYELLNHQQTGAVVVCRRAGGINNIIDFTGPRSKRAILLAAIARHEAGTESRILLAGDRLADDCRQVGFLLRGYGARLIAATRSVGLRQDLKPGCLDIFAGTGDADLLRHVSPAIPNGSRTP